MKRNLIKFLFVFSIPFLISWGKVGHRTVGLIAQNHLTDQAKQGIHHLIGDTSLADISNYADEILSQSQFKYTSPWHYINIPSGLNYMQFNKAVREQNQDNVYKELKALELVLISPVKNKVEKIFALKMIVHLIGDLHQPMHVSRAEDLGGNKIKITFMGKEGNLHGLWDSGLIEYEFMTFGQLAVKYDHATPVQINRWQNDDVLIWLFESYQASTKLYKEAETSSDFGKDYYDTHLNIVADRIEKAGIRLAGVLNEAFGGGPYYIISPPTVVALLKADPTPEDIKEFTLVHKVNSNEVFNYINKHVTTSGKVESTRFIKSNNMTILNIGAAYPNQDFSIRIKSENRYKFGQPENDFNGKTVTVTGLVVDANGKPEIEITMPSQIQIIN